MSTAEKHKRHNAKRQRDPEYRAKQAERYRAWYERNGKVPERLARKAARMRVYSKAPGTAEHHRARRRTRSAIESGQLMRQPCEACGTSPAHAHHDDYSKPLEVRWLCPKHHREYHARATGEQP